MNRPELIWLLTKVANNLISVEEAANKILDIKYETCPICKGKGIVFNLINGEIICETCKGERQIKI